MPTPQSSADRAAGDGLADLRQRAAEELAEQAELDVVVDVDEGDAVAGGKR